MENLSKKGDIIILPVIHNSSIPLLEMNGILGYDLMEIDIEHIDKIARIITAQYESDNFLTTLYGSDKYPEVENKTKIIVPDEDTAWLIVARLKSVGLQDIMMPKFEVAGVDILDINQKRRR